MGSYYTMSTVDRPHKLTRDVSVSTDDLAVDGVDGGQYDGDVLHDLWMEAGFLDTPLADLCHVTGCEDVTCCSCRVGSGLNITLLDISDFSLQHIGSGFFSTIHKV
jgi:hypothetical protein